MYLRVGELEFCDPFGISLYVPEVPNVSMACPRPPVCLSIWIVVCCEAQAPVPLVSQVAQLVYVKRVLLLRCQAREPP